MTEHFKFDIHVTVYGQAAMDFQQRGQELKQDCADAVKKALEEKGYKAYQKEYWVTV